MSSAQWGSLHYQRRYTHAVVLLVLSFLALLPLPVLSEPAVAPGNPGPIARGDVERGRALVREAGCGNCHQIPGIALARGRVGPTLDKLARRAYLAGVLPNNYENLVLWLTRTQEVAPQSAMPDLDLSNAEAENIAAFLYTLD